jgi:hypothetical protein
VAKHRAEGKDAGQKIFSTLYPPATITDDSCSWDTTGRRERAKPQLMAGIEQGRVTTGTLDQELDEFLVHAATVDMSWDLAGRVLGRQVGALTVAKSMVYLVGVRE